MATLELSAARDHDHARPMPRASLASVPGICCTFVTPNRFLGTRPLLCIATSRPRHMIDLTGPTRPPPRPQAGWPAGGLVPRRRGHLPCAAAPRSARRWMARSAAKALPCETMTAAGQWTRGSGAGVAGGSGRRHTEAPAAQNSERSRRVSRRAVLSGRMARDPAPLPDAPAATRPRRPANPLAAPPRPLYDSIPHHRCFVVAWLPWTTTHSRGGPHSRPGGSASRSPAPQQVPSRDACDARVMLV